MTEEARQARNAYHRAYMAKLSPEQRAARAEYLKRWRADNADRLNAYNKEWRRTHPENIRAANKRYWERKAAERGGADYGA